MKVVVIGGSNSRSKAGWVTQLSAKICEIEIVNHAIGAQSSVMGFFQLQSYQGLEPGDIVLWEYALNDDSQISVMATPIDRALQYVELCLRQTQQRHAFFVPIILRRREMRDGSQSTAYLDRLAELFAAYDVEPIDIADLWRAKTGDHEIPKSCYRDALHFEENGLAMSLVVDAACRAIAAPRMGRQRDQPVSPLDLSSVRYLREFSGGSAVPFTNSAISVTVHQPPWEKGMVMRAIAPEQGVWRVVGVVLLRSKARAQYVIGAGQVAQKVPAFHSRADFDKLMLSWLPLDQNGSLTLRPGRAISIRWSALADGSDSIPPEQGVVALHLERIPDEVAPPAPRRDRIRVPQNKGAGPGRMGRILHRIVNYIKRRLR